MAQRRMFNKAVTNDDNFLELPATAQNLYFHLSMNADDDGFINNWKSIMRMIGSKEDDIKLLIAKSYLIPFESGVIVIKHWRLNNYLQKDRITPTNYKEEMALLELDKNNVYSLYTECIHRLDKNRLDKIRIDKNIYDIVEQELAMTLSPGNFEKINMLIETYGEDKFLEAVNKASNGNKKSLNYVEGILKNKNYKTKEPSWINQDLTKQEEEINEEDAKWVEEIYRNIQTDTSIF